MIQSRLLKTYPPRPGEDTSATFSGHEAFPCRYGWLKKGFDAVAENPAVFSSDRATTTLGVGKNMVRSIRHWCLAFNVIEEDLSVTKGRNRRLKPTRIGAAIFDDQDGFDPYLENPSTLWLIHWLLSTNANRATTWFWTFNHFTRNEFSRQQMETELKQSIKKKYRKIPSDNSIKRDVGCFIRTYVPSRGDDSKNLEDTFNSPLTELELVYQTENPLEIFRYNTGHKATLPIDIIAASISEFWDSYYPTQDTLPFDKLAFSNNEEPICPASIFKIDQHSMVVYAERLEEYTDGDFRYDDTAGIKLIYRQRRVEASEFLSSFYKRPFAPSEKTYQHPELADIN